MHSYQVEVVVVVGPVHVEQLDDVGVVAELPEEDDLPEGALGVGPVAEGVVDALYRHHATGPEGEAKKIKHEIKSSIKRTVWEHFNLIVVHFKILISTISRFKFNF